MAVQNLDVIVIGAGIAGVGVAAMLAGDARLVVLESEPRPGQHTTGRSAAMFIRNYGGAAIRAVTAASESYLANPPDLLDQPGFLSPRGELILATAEQSALVDELLAEAGSLEEVTIEQALALVPILRPEPIDRAIYEADACDIDVDRLFQSWLKELPRQGAQVISNAQAQILKRVGEQWRVSTPAGDFQAPVVVNAAGAWADVLAERAGVAALGVKALRRSAALLPLPAETSARSWPLVGSITEGWYARPMSGKLMVSPADEEPVEPHDAFADDLVIAQGLHRFEQATTFAVTRVDYTWAGLRTFGADRNPVVGFDSRAPGFFWLAGQGGYGVQTAPALSRLAADLIAGRNTSMPLPPEVVSALDPARFQCRVS